MTPAACPNCSGFVSDPPHWVIGRPQLFISRRTHRVLIVGCCPFSGRSRHSFATEEEACATWDAYRTARAAKDPRMQSMLERLNELEQRLKPRETNAAA
jgi:hypothetical protein